MSTAGRPRVPSHKNVAPASGLSWPLLLLSLLPYALRSCMRFAGVPVAWRPLFTEMHGLHVCLVSLSPSITPAIDVVVDIECWSTGGAFFKWAADLSQL